MTISNNNILNEIISIESKLDIYKNNLEKIDEFNYNYY